MDHTDYKIAMYSNGLKRKHKHYEKEKTFETYWKYHCNDVEYFNKMGLNQGLIAYLNGVEIRRYGVFENEKDAKSVSS